MSDIGTPFDKKRFLSTLGLCVRAGKILFGLPSVHEAMQKKADSVVLVFEASDTSDNTHKKITDKCRFYGVRHVRVDVGGDELAHSLGKDRFLAVVGLTDIQLGRAIEALLPEIPRM